MEHKNRIVTTLYGRMTLAKACVSWSTDITEFNGWNFAMVQGWFNQFIPTIQIKR